MRPETLYSIFAGFCANCCSLRCLRRADSNLKHMLAFGIGMHHAGLVAKVRPGIAFAMSRL
jgi:hypothetical protein